ncbi:MAG: hypothetical protein AM325_011320 [Candidatus Thorarchaeota archaeon SMTZ1-45]
MKFEPVLVIYTFFSPSIGEAEVWGIGEHYVLDAVVRRSFTSSLFWVFEGWSAETLTGEPNSAQLIFPYSAPPLATMLWLVGCLSTVLVWMVLKGYVSREIGLFLVIITLLLPFFIPGISTNIVEESYTYNRTPLPVSQMIGFIILMFKRKWNITK